MSSVRDSVAYGKTILSYAIHRADRRTLEIAVHPDGNIVVRSPRNADSEDIRKRILKRAGWIIRQHNHFLPLVDPSRASHLYLNGATHHYLGRSCRLKIAQSKEPAILHSRGFLHVAIEGRVSQRAVQEALEAWYRQRAEALFPAILEKVWPRFQKNAPEPPRLQIRTLKKRWGSLSPKPTLTLNLALIRAPRECIEYVVVHELCHLAHHDHGKGFYRLLNKVMPDWEKRKRKLEMGRY